MHQAQGLLKLRCIVYKGTMMAFEATVSQKVIGIVEYRMGICASKPE